MKALLIDATNCAFKEVEWTDYKDLCRYVEGGIGMAGSFANGDAVYVDDEGINVGKSTWFFLQGIDQPLAGNGIVTGPDRFDRTTGREWTIDVQTTLEELAARVTFKTDAQVRAWAMANASEPAVAITSTEKDGSIKREVLATWSDLIGGARPIRDPGDA